MSVVGQLGRAESQLGKFELGLVLSGVAVARARQLIRRPAARNPNVPLVQRRRIVRQPTRVIFALAHPAHRYKSATKPISLRRRVVSRRPLFIFPVVHRQLRKAVRRPVSKPVLRAARRVAGIFVAPPTLIRVARGIIKYQPLPVGRARKPRPTGHRLFHPTGMPFVRIARPAQRFKVRPRPSVITRPARHIRHATGLPFMRVARAIRSRAILAIRPVKSRPARRLVAPILAKARLAKRYRFIPTIKSAKPRQARRIVAPLLAIAHVVRRRKIIVRPKVARRIQRKPESLVLLGPALSAAHRAGLRSKAPQVITITYYMGNNPVTITVPAGNINNPWLKSLGMMMNRR